MATGRKNLDPLLPAWHWRWNLPSGQ